MPENSDIVIANLPAGGPAEVTTLVEDAAQARLPDEPAVGHIATPGQGEPDNTNFGVHEQDDEEFFLKDIVRPKEPEGEGDGTAPAPEGAAVPAGNVSPPPAEPSTVPPGTVGSPIDAELLGIAESFGLSKDEAESYGTPQQLLKTLHLIARNLPPVEDAPPAAGSSKPVTKPAAATPEPDLEFPDPKALEEAGWNPEIVQMAKSMKAMHDRYKAKIEEVDKILPNLVEDAQRRQAADRQRGIEETFKEAGFDAKSYPAPVLNKIVSRVSALYRTYQAEGETPPVSEIIKSVIPLVVAGAKPKPGVTNGTPTNGATKPVDPALAAAAKRRADAVARAKLAGRNGIGQFTGGPTHRRGGEVTRGGALRQAMLDRGMDPGEATSSSDSGDTDWTLPG